VAKSFVAGADISEFCKFLHRTRIPTAAEGQEKLFDFIENLKHLLLPK
jgi:enoyl-CoA hydratase